MAALEAIYGLVGVLGGASIGAIGTGLAQRSSRRADERNTAREQSRQARHLAQEQSRQARQLALEAVAAGRVAARSWSLHMETVLQNVEANRPVDIDSYDTTVLDLLDVITTALYRLTSTEGITLVGGTSSSVRTSLTETTTLIRRALLQNLTNQLSNHTTTELRDKVQGAASALDLLLTRQTEHLRGGPIPADFVLPAPARSGRTLPGLP
ncbi:hypothetical protein [Streptomyces sp. YS-3]|uniref:hypothetical protein n=1 Tax=Streptomyces sp. YS-3 TaxID=3381352 RepID=UPI0038622BD7